VRPALVAAVLLAVVLSGASSAASASNDRLTITVWAQGRGVGKPVSSASLTCRPAGGSHPYPGRACRRLFAHLAALKPVPRTRACPEVYGGPDVALVQGRVKGQRVRSWLNRRNGCQIERWNALGIVLDV
jgi:hypothetical protein